MTERTHSVTIGSVRIDNVNMEESIQHLLDCTKDTNKHHFSTPNLDFLYNAGRNQSFRRILNNCSLNIPDGKPLVLISRAMGEPLKEKVSGADFFVEVCKSSAKNGLTVFLMGSAPGVAKKAKQNLESEFEGLNIVGAISPSFGFEKNEKESKELVEEINKKRPDILFVGVGSPKQELWINKHLEQLEIKVAIGVGASFDFAAGHVKIPPPGVKKVGAAWLWRLVSEPRRLWKRYLVNNLPLFIKLYARAFLKRVGSN